MPSPSREDRICAMLDSFAKTVCRNFVRNLRRDEPIRDSHLADEQAADILEQIGHGDTYPSDFFVLYVDGHPNLHHAEQTILPHLSEVCAAIPFGQGFRRDPRLGMDGVGESSR